MPRWEGIDFYSTQSPVEIQQNLDDLAAYTKQFDAQGLAAFDSYAYLRRLFEELPKANTAEALEVLLPLNVKPAWDRSATIDLT